MNCRLNLLARRQVAEVRYQEEFQCANDASVESSARDSAPVGIRIDDSIDAAAWDSYVGNHADGTIYHTSGWRNIIQRTFGKEMHYLATVDSDARVCGILPLARQKSMLLGDRLVSMPYCNYGGPLADSPALATRLVREAQDLGARLKCSDLELRNLQEVAADGLHSRTDKVRMVLTLPDSSDDFGKALGSKRRSQIRRSQRNNPEVRHGGAELVSDFYTVFCQNMHDLGTPVYPRRLFDHVVEEWPNNTALTVVYIDGEPAASAFLVANRSMLEIPWASALRKYNSISVNMLLYWEVLKWAIEHKYAAFDFGRCTRNEGTYRFKKQWGTEEQQLHWLTHNYKGDAPATASSDSGARQLVANVWRRLPLGVANFVGPRITSNLPW